VLNYISLDVPGQCLKLLECHNHFLCVCNGTKGVPDGWYV
jgi:hypothetical protein